MNPPPRRYHPIITLGLENASANQLNFVLGKRAERVEQDAIRLREMVCRIDATGLFLELDLACRDKLQLTGHYDSVIDKLRFAWVSKMAYLARIATTAVRGSDPVTRDVAENILVQLIKVYEAWNARHYMEFFAESVAAIGDRPDRAGVPLGDSNDKRIAAQYRAALYTSFGAGNIADDGLLALHERVAVTVFESQRDRYCSEIGFCPSDLVRIANTYARLQIAHTRDLPDTAERTGIPEPDTSLSYPLMSGCLWSVDDVAETVNIDRVEASTMLETFCTEFDSHEGLLLPGDSNPCQRQPLLRVSDETYVVPHLALIPAAVYAWTLHHARTTEGTTTVTQTFAREQRPRATENIVADALRQVFADDTVFPNMEYRDKRLQLAGELDCIVDSAVPILVEVKDLKLFDEGRRGDMVSVGRVAKDAFGKAYDQLTRARRFIIDEGGRQFRSCRDALSDTVLELSADIPDLVCILVTFEEQAGVGSDAWAFTQLAHPPSVWTTSLSSFILICDHLTGDPAGFFHYARTRQQQNSEGFHHRNEIRSLAEYLHDRFACITSDTEGWLAREHPHSSELRALAARLASFYTEPTDAPALSQEISRVPTEITRALSDCAARHSLDWVRAAEAVMRVPPQSWEKWRRHRRRYPDGERPFQLPGVNVRLVLSTTRRAATLSDGRTLTLHVPSTNHGGRAGRETASTHASSSRSIQGTDRAT